MPERGIVEVQTTGQAGRSLVAAVNPQQINGLVKRRDALAARHNHGFDPSCLERPSERSQAIDRCQAERKIRVGQAIGQHLKRARVTQSADRCRRGVTNRAGLSLQG